MTTRLLQILFGLFLLAVPTAVQTGVAAQDAQDTGIFYVVSKTLNVRFGPSTDGDVAKRLERGEKVFVFETQDGWARISKPFSGESVGLPGMAAYWVSLRFLAREAPQEQ